MRFNLEEDKKYFTDLLAELKKNLVILSAFCFHDFR